jgi:lipid II:glycine glycyltransferase (peptidoglycan interpeptide bridge formation enzyme)
MKQDKKESMVNLAAEEIDAELKRIAPNYFLTIMVPEFSDIRPFQWLNYRITPSYTYMINLKPELDDIWEGFTSLCKQCIRKGEDLKCQLVRGDDTVGLTDLLTERYNEQGLNQMINPEYLKEVLKTYPENLILQSLFDNDELVGVTLNQAYHRYLGWMGLTKPKNKKYNNANEFMIWQLIQQAKSLGFDKFEINGANKQNLCQFRTKFNPHLEMYFTLSKKDTLGKLAETFYFRFIKKF